MSPLRAAAMAIGQHNESVKWNFKLLGNSAKPSGVMTFKEKGNGSIPPDNEQIKKIRDDFNNQYSGPENAGKIPFLNFDMQWQALGMTPVDMDWLNGKNSSARDIALALGYPPFLLGMSEGSTFNNVREAKLSLYQNTVVPMTESILDSIAHWLSQKTDQDIEIKPDLDAVDALALQRESILEQSRKDVESGIITPNEARALRKYDDEPNADDLLIPAGKLPLSFDPASMDDKQFKSWLLKEGMSAEAAEKISKMSRN